MKAKETDSVVTVYTDGKEHGASKGSLAVLKKHGYDIGKAVKSGDFDWARDPYAAAQDALQVAKSKGLVKETRRLSKSELKKLVREAMEQGSGTVPHITAELSKAREEADGMVSHMERAIDDLEALLDRGDLDPEAEKTIESVSSLLKAGIYFPTKNIYPLD